MKGVEDKTLWLLAVVFASIVVGVLLLTILGYGSDLFKPVIKLFDQFMPK